MSDPSALTEEQRDQFFFMSIVQNFQQLAWGGLGKIANPDQEEPKVDLEQARWAVDMLGMLQRRTKGNLSPEEDRELSQILYTLRMNFVDVQENSPDSKSDASEPPQEAASTDEPSEDAGSNADSSDEASEAGAPEEPQDTQ